MLGVARVSSPSRAPKKQTIPKPECQHWWFDDLDKEIHCLYCGAVRYENEVVRRKSDASYAMD